MSWACGKCEKGMPEKKIQMPHGDFGTVINHHCSQLQRRLCVEYQQVVGERERQYMETLELARRENDELRNQLRLPAGQSAFWPPARETHGSRYIPAATPRTVATSNRFFEEALHLRQHQASSPQRVNETIHTRASPWQSMGRPDFGDGFGTGGKPLLAALPLALKTLEELQTTLLESMVSGNLGSGNVGGGNVGGGNVNLTQAPGFLPVTESTPLRAVAPFDATDGTGMGDPTLSNVMDTNASVMMTQGSMSHLQFKAFTPHSFWTDTEMSAAASKIMNKKGEQKPSLAVQMSRIEPQDPVRHGVVLSPNSAFCLMWNCAFMVVLCYELVMMPMQVFPLPKGGALEVTSYSALTFWTLDFILSFFVGYYTKDGGIVMDHARIGIHYAKTWMMPDAIVISIDWLDVLNLSSGAANASGFLRIGKALRYFRVLRILRVLRLHKLKEAVQTIDEFFNSRYFTIGKSIISNMLVIMVVSHFLGCFWYLIGIGSYDGYPSWVSFYDLQDTDVGYQYLTALHWSLTQFTPGSMHVQPQNVIERAFAVFVLLCGMIIFSSIVSSITAATNSLKNMNAAYNNHVWTLRKFFKEQHISPDLTSRVLRYCEGVLKTKYLHVSLHEVAVLDRLPQNLRLEVMLELYDQYLVVHPFFASMLSRNRNLVQKLAFNCVTDLVLAQGDELFAPGQVCVAMYFVTMGELTYRMDHLDKIEIIKSHQWLCEAVLWTDWVHQGRVVATGECELVAIDCRKFHDTVSKFATDRIWAFEQYGKKFVQGMNELAGFTTNETDDDVDLSDCLIIQSAIDSIAGEGTWTPERGFKIGSWHSNS